MAQEWDDIMTAIADVEPVEILTDSQKMRYVERATTGSGLIITATVEDDAWFIAVETGEDLDTYTRAARPGDTFADAAYMAVQCYLDARIPRAYPVREES